MGWEDERGTTNSLWTREVMPLTRVRCSRGSRVHKRHFFHSSKKLRSSEHKFVHPVREERLVGRGGLSSSIQHPIRMSRAVMFLRERGSWSESPAGTDTRKSKAVQYRSIAHWLIADASGFALWNRNTVQRPALSPALYLRLSLIYRDMQKCLEISSPRENMLVQIDPDIKIPTG